MELLLEARNISNTFPGVRALRDVGLAVRPGEVHALLGENGAGKSTLIKIVTGILEPDPGGSLAICGQTVEHNSPERAAGLGVSAIYQHPTLFAELTVLGRPPILVPLPGAIDADQKNNAMVMEAAGGAWIAEQATLSPQSLGTRLTNLLSQPAKLTQAAAAARSLGQPRAVEKLADIAETLSGKNVLEHTP